MFKPILFAWIGHADLRGPLEEKEKGAGPIAQALAALSFDEAHLLHDMQAAEARDYAAWLRKRTDAWVVLHHAPLSSPVHFGEIHEAAVRVVSGVLREKGAAPGTPGLDVTFHLSPGTPAMAAVWIILGKTRFPATLIESSREHGVKTAAVP
ncbi:MAG: AAA family ATPase, partial [Candidatus Eisenbacteria bacterium]